MFKKRYLYFLIILFLMFFIADSILAGGASGSWEEDSLEVYYPSIPGLPKITAYSPLGDFISYWFGLLIYVAGALSLISFTIGAISLINPNPESHNDAKDRMKGSILGLVLTLASFLIIRTINPSLTTPSLTPLPGVAGVFYTNGTNLKTAVQEEPDVATNVLPEYRALFYKCDSSTGPVLFLWKFPNKNYDTAGASVQTVLCNNTVSLNGVGSFKTDYKKTGVYYFLGAGCTGYMSQVNFSDQEQIDYLFRYHGIKSVLIVNNPTNGIYYGVVFHNSPDLGSAGYCTYPIATNQAEQCLNVNIVSYSGENLFPTAANIFLWNYTYTTSGAGVDLYSGPFGEKSGAGEGYYKLSANDIKSGYWFDVKKLKFSYEGVDSAKADFCRKYPSCNTTAKGEKCCPCETFQDCPGSIDIKGSYLVGLYSATKSVNGAKSGYCQTFYRSVPNLGAEDLTQPNVAKLDTIVITPTK